MEVIAPPVEPVSEAPVVEETKSQVETQAVVTPVTPEPLAAEPVVNYEESYKKLLPEFTKRSQILSALQAKTTPVAEPAKATIEQAPWEKDPNWQPDNYPQLVGTLEQRIEQKVWNQILDAASAEDRQSKEQDAYIEAEKAELLKIDPTADVNRVMAHAGKYAFSSLTHAYQNMKAIDDAERRVEERVLKNIQARSAAPVGVPAGGGAAPSFPANVRTGLEKARYLIRNQT